MAVLTILGLVIGPFLEVLGELISQYGWERGSV